MSRFHALPMTLMWRSFLPMTLMRRSFPCVSALALAVGLTFGAVEAMAQAAAPGPAAGQQIQAVTYAPIPEGAAFEVQANDDDELTQETIERVNSELPNRGYAAQDGASLVMVVETDLVRGVEQDNPLAQSYAPVAGKDHDQVQGQVKAPLFSSTQNSLLNPKPSFGSADRTYRISLAVYDRKSGLYVWRATAMRNDPNLDVTTATNEMVSALVAGVGRSLPLETAPAP